MTKLDIERTELSFFSEGVRAEAARSLDLLRAIDGTLDGLNHLVAVLRADAIFAERVMGVALRRDEVVDPDGTLVGALESAQGCVNELYELLVVKRQAGRDDHLLTEEDGIEAAYTEAIAAAADLHNNINTLRWAIMEHDADLASPSDSARVAASPEDIERIFDEIIRG